MVNDPFMSNTLLLCFSWIAVAVHLIVGLSTVRRWSDLPLLPLLNGFAAVCLLLYCMQKWYSHIVHDIRWYASDQLLPLYALCLCVLTGLALSGRYQGQWLHWAVFAVDLVVLVGAALFFTFFRMDRLI